LYNDQCWYLFITVQKYTFFLEWQKKIIQALKGRRIILMLWLDNAPHPGLSMFDGATHPGLSMFDGATHPGLPMLDGATHPGLPMLDGATHPAAMRHPSPRGDGAAALH